MRDMSVMRLSFLSFVFVIFAVAHGGLVGAVVPRSVPKHSDSSFPSVKASSLSSLSRNRFKAKRLSVGQVMKNAGKLFDDVFTAKKENSKALAVKPMVSDGKSGTVHAKNQQNHYAEKNIVNHLLAKAVAEKETSGVARTAPKGDTLDKAGNVYLCPSGHFSVGAKCEPCAPGTFSEAGSAMCSLCPAGSYSDAVGQPSCTPCPAGLYNPQPGGRDKFACVECLAGHSCAKEETGVPQKCSKGTFSPVGSGLCEACPTFFSPNKAQGACNAKASFYVATSSLSFAFFGMIGVMAGRIKKAARHAEEDGEDESEDEFDIYGSVESADAIVQSKLALEGSPTAGERKPRASILDYGIL